MTHDPTRDCEHGRLKGKCDVCDLQAEVERLNRVNAELVEALKRVMDNDCPLTGNPSHAELVEHWEYEKSQGRGEADDQLFALAALAKATGETK